MKEEKINKAIEEIKNNTISSETKQLITSIFFTFNEVIPKDIDAIIVIGSKDMNFKQVAKEYEKIKKPMICTGGKPFLFLKEGEYYVEKLIKHKIPKQDIFLEDQSLNLEQQLKYSFQLVLTRFSLQPSILIMAAHYLLPVISLVSNQLIEENEWPITMTLHPIASKKINNSNWFSKKKTRMIIINELEKIVFSSKKKRPI